MEIVLEYITLVESTNTFQFDSETATPRNIA